MAIEIRGGALADYAAYVRLLAQLHIDDPVPSPEQYAAEVMPRTVMAVEQGAVVGYALFDVLEDIGYVRNLVSDPARRRTGVGRALMAWMRARFATAGATSWCLNVKPDNEVAIALYESCGLRVAYRSFILRFARELELPPPPAELSLDLAPASEDAQLERDFGLLPGLLAAMRPRPGRKVFRLRREGETVGATVFFDGIPNGFPFRMRDPAYGVPFVALLRAHVPAEAAFLQVGADGDEPLYAALTAGGARVYLELLHMRGALSG